MTLEDLNKLKIGKSNIKEVVTSTKNEVLEKIQKDFNCNKTVAEYLLFNGMSYNIVYNELVEHINWLDENNRFGGEGND